ncbi:MAG: sugar phosphate isomerase/epimerase family protein [Flavobacterium sp.]|uniref:sugar phosphate isomerase/epimerase family protein n=1 Tax=Flavobacterium sp. TaxID=239 RepID=UPI003266988D
MKLAISNIAWSSEDDEQMHFFLKSAGFEGLEIAPTRIIPENPYDKLKEAEAFKNTLKTDFSLTIPSLQAICFGRNEAIFGKEEERESIKEYIKKAIDFASVLDCKNLVFGSPKNRIIGENQEDIAMSFFAELGTYANKKNTILAMEPNPDIYGTNFLNTTQQAVDFVKEIKNKGLKINVDLGTIIHNNEDIAIIANNIELINHIHISEPFLEPITERDIHNDLYQILKENNYSNYLSIEMKNTNDTAIVKNAIYYLKDVFKRK